MQRQAAGDPNQRRTVQLCGDIVASCNRRLQVGGAALPGADYVAVQRRFTGLSKYSVLPPLGPQLQAVAEEKAAEEAAKRAAPVPLAGRLLLLALALLYVLFAYRIEQVGWDSEL